MKLDNFFVSGANEEAVAMAEAVLNNVKAYSPVLIYAKPGRGKTHLLHEIQDKCKSALAGQKVAFTTGRQFLEDKNRLVNTCSASRFPKISSRSSMSRISTSS